MNYLSQKLLACAVLGLLATPAQAVPITLVFNDGGFSTESIKTYSESGISVDVTASWSLDRTSDASSGFNTNVSLNGVFGIGVLNSGEDGNPTDEYSIDGVNVFDRLTFAFNETVKLISAEFFYYDDNVNFTLFADSDNNQQFDTSMDLSFLPTTPDHGNISLANLNLFGDLFGFGAGSLGEFNPSRFKLISMTVDDDISSVPVPASLPLFGTGLALMGYLGMRRRKKAKA